MSSKANKNETKGVRAWHRPMVAVVAGLITSAVLALVTPAQAQNAGAAAWTKGGCSACHGLVADGGGGGDMPAGPSLRRTRLDRDQLSEAIACGRPGTGMPYNMTGAYTQTACYGLTGAVPAGTMRGGNFTAAEIDALANFLAAEVVGKIRVTRAACAVLFEGDLNAIACAQYPQQ